MLWRLCPRGMAVGTAQAMVHERYLRYLRYLRG